MTYHPDGDATDNSSKWFHEDAWLNANGVEVWREVDQVYPAMLDDYQLTDPVKPSLFLEGSYEYGSYRHECGWVTPVKLRRQMYHTFFAGGAGFTYGAGPIWAMRGNGGDYNYGYTWKQALAFPGAVQFAGIAKRFLLSKPVVRMDSGRALDRRRTGRRGKLQGGGHSRRAPRWFISPITGSKIRNMLSKQRPCPWFDPRDGHQDVAGKFERNESRNMIPPDRWEDAVLILSARE